MLKAPYILLAEDSDDDTYFAQRCFAASGTQIELKRSENGIELCDHLKSCGQHLPLAIVLDLKMPLMDGFEALEWIRDQDEFKALPVVVLSSSAMAQDIERARNLGATEYLVKPNSFKQLETLLKELASRLLNRLK